MAESAVITLSYYVFSSMMLLMNISKHSAGRCQLHVLNGLDPRIAEPVGVLFGFGFGHDANDGLGVGFSNLHPGFVHLDFQAVNSIDLLAADLIFQSGHDGIGIPSSDIHLFLGHDVLGQSFPQCGDGAVSRGAV